MKKLIQTLFALVMVAMTLSSCEDVPAPFDTSFHENPSDTVTTVDPVGEGTLASPYNVAKSLAIIKAGTFTSDNVYIKGVITKIDNIDTSFGNAVYYLGDTGTDKSTLEVYRGKYFNGDKFTTGKEIAVGDTVVVYGTLTLFNSTPEVAAGSQIVTINGKTEGGSTPPVTPPASGITVDGTTVTAVNKDVTAGTTTLTIDLNTLGWANATDPTVVTLSDGSTITFEQNTNPTNSPKFYDATKGVRLYANNSIKFACKSTIAKIIFTCDAYNGTNYVGNDTQTISFDGANATYVNTYATSSGGVQLRVQTITITYAQ